MNREALYLEIGNIDDDLICEADRAQGLKNRRSYVSYFAGIAACLCLICGGVLYNLQRDVIHYNTATITDSSKVVIPEGTTVRDLTYSGLFDYYGLKEFPDAFSKLHLSKRNEYPVYENAGEIIFDENRFEYVSADGGQTVWITVGTDEYCIVFDETAEKSRIDGVSMVLAVSETVSGQYLYSAQIGEWDSYVRVVARGMEEEAFINVIRELIKSQKN